MMHSLNPHSTARAHAPAPCAPAKPRLRDRAPRIIEAPRAVRPCTILQQTSSRVVQAELFRVDVLRHAGSFPQQCELLRLSQRPRPYVCFTCTFTGCACTPRAIPRFPCHATGYTNFRFAKRKMAYFLHLRPSHGRELHRPHEDRPPPCLPRIALFLA